MEHEIELMNVASELNNFLLDFEELPEQVVLDVRRVVEILEKHF